MTENDAPHAARARGGYAKGDRRRAEILNTAFFAFAAGGYRSASMVQIAAACGVSRAGLQHHFPTKEALLTAVLEERDRINGDLFFQGSDPRRDGIDYLRRLLDVVAHNVTQREIVALFAVLSAEASDPEHPAHAYFVARYRWLRTDIADALAEAERSGRTRPGALQPGLASDLIALIDGLQVQWLLEPSSVDIVERLRSRLQEIVTEDLSV
ncbi:TetR/AcrR family transcriptional regulator [Demequina gelatinilytica]|uniref:TetR/AcrR family transcriptional regulator n=1 Tax=Demequina gelatinilytica TaxID=1638980 RepID=UPI000785D9C5|nr:TetR/AcrR family transcriptional regulator [Demequina gelatinilytica]